MSEDILNRMSERMRNRISNKIFHKLLEDMSDKIPKNMLKFQKNPNKIY